MAWVTPTGQFDLNGEWRDDAYVRDNDLGTATYILNAGYYLEVSLSSAIICNKVRVYYPHDKYNNATSWNLDVYYGGEWHNIHSGVSGGDEQWYEINVGSSQSISKLRIKLNGTNRLYIHEVDFWEVEISAPTVTTQAVDDITPTTATGNGTITDTGGENCSKRGVCWNTGGNPTIADDKSEETDSFGAEAFDVPMAGLDPGTLYYVRAYAYNSAGYGYGSQVEFTTTQVISPSAIAAPSAVQPPTLSGSGSAPITAPPVATPSAVQAPALSGSGAAPITLSPIASISAVQAPTIATSVQFITPSPVAVSSSIQTPSLSGSGVASVSPSAVSVGSSVQSPALSGSGAAPVTASPMATVSSIQAPVLEPTGAAPVSPSPMQASSAVQAPSMSGSGVATISSSPIAAASAIQTPSIATGVQSIAPLPVAVTSIIVAPIISVAISYRYRYNVFTDNLDIVRAAMSYRYRYNVFTGNQDILGRF